MPKRSRTVCSSDPASRAPLRFGPLKKVAGPCAAGVLCLLPAQEPSSFLLWQRWWERVEGSTAGPLKAGPGEAWLARPVERATLDLGVSSSPTLGVQITSKTQHHHHQRLASESRDPLWPDAAPSARHFTPSGARRGPSLGFEPSNQGNFHSLEVTRDFLQPVWKWIEANTSL